MNALAADIPYRRLLPPAVLLFGDDAHRRLAIAEVIARGGGRVVANAGLSDAAARIEMQAAAGGVVLDLRNDEGAMLDTLLGRVDSLGETAGRLFGIVIVTPALIDPVAARVSGTGTLILVEPDAEELADAIADLVAVRQPWVEEGAEAGSRRLAQLSEEVGRIARTLAALSGDEAVSTTPAPVVAASSADGPLLRAFLRVRRLRGQHFVPALFADPAWDILLDLAAARIEGRMVAVSSLCIAAAVPATTALRWITQMTEQALLVRRPDANDGRRVFITLSDSAAAAMDAYLASARRIIAPVG